jgi:hypothetical protein
MSEKLKIDAAIDKAATECVEELLAAGRKSGGAPWLDIIRRKMRQAFAGAEPPTPTLRLGTLSFETFRGGLRIVRLWPADVDADEVSELALLGKASTAKLARWLNGGE